MNKAQLESWKSEQPTLGEKQTIVWQTLHRRSANLLKGLTLFELADVLQWPINCVSGRVTELRKRGWIKDSGLTRMNPHSGKQCTVWVISVPEPDKQMELI